MNQFEPWDKPSVYEQFETKLNAYIHIIVSGALYDKYPDLKGKPIRIRLYFYFDPSVEIRDKLETINEKFLTPLVRFEMKKLEPPKRKKFSTLREIIALFLKRKSPKK